MNTKPSFYNFLTGSGGVLYPPKCFYRDILRKDLFMELSPSNDDVWFWAMLVLNDTKINVINDNQSHLEYIEGTQETNLRKKNVIEEEYDICLSNVIKHYPKIMRNLNLEIRQSKMSFRHFFKRARRKAIRILLGRTLYDNIVNLNQTYESILRLVNDITISMTDINRIFSNGESSLTKKDLDILDEKICTLTKLMLESKDKNSLLAQIFLH